MSDVILHNIFPTTISQYNIGVDKKIKRQLIDEAYDFIHQHGIKNGSTTVNKYILNNKKYSSLSKTILDKLNDIIYNIYTVDKNLKFFITNSWCVKHEKNDVAALHNHNNSIISGVYYFQTPKNCGDIIFNRNTTLNSVFTETLTIPTNSNLDEYRVKVEEGTLLLFPSHLLHKTEPNLSNKSRYCLAFNVFLKGSIGKDQGLNRLDI
tara:strand:- start:67 stop:690 length:624 start_codon:yes stop_codon:yes gene_type:complete